jgi:hypothetical protein
MLRSAILLLSLLAVPPPALGQGTEAPADAVCVVNGSDHTHVFVAEARGAERRRGELAPGERLCARGATEAAGGVVSVFEHADAFEGCSRLLQPGQTEVMKKYVDFDRCFWRSNS